MIRLFPCNKHFDTQAQNSKSTRPEKNPNIFNSMCALASKLHSPGWMDSIDVYTGCMGVQLNAKMKYTMLILNFSCMFVRWPGGK